MMFHGFLGVAINDKGITQVALDEDAKNILKQIHRKLKKQDTLHFSLYKGVASFENNKVRFSNKDITLKAKKSNNQLIVDEVIYS